MKRHACPGRSFQYLDCSVVFARGFSRDDEAGRPIVEGSRRPNETKCICDAEFKVDHVTGRCRHEDRCRFQPGSDVAPGGCSELSKKGMSKIDMPVS